MISSLEVRIKNYTLKLFDGLMPEVLERRRAKRKTIVNVTPNSKPKDDPPPNKNSDVRKSN